jgi:hypothetical protein
MGRDFMTYCGKCGQQLKPGARFCRFCGAPTGPSGLLSALPLASSVQPSGRSNLGPILWGGITAAILVLGVIGVAAWKLEFFSRDESVITEPTEVGTPEEVAEWKASYADDFLSETVTVRTAGAANVRDYPSSNGTVVQSILPEGARSQVDWWPGECDL